MPQSRLGLRFSGLNRCGLRGGFGEGVLGGATKAVLRSSRHALTCPCSTSSSVSLQPRERAEAWTSLSMEAR